VEEGIACYRRALAIDPGQQEIHTNLGVALAEQGQTDEARACYQQARSLKPEDPGPYTNQLFLAAYQSLLQPREYLALARGWEQVALSAQARETARLRRIIRPARP